MKQKFQNLGMLLTKEQTKKLVGGDDDGGSCVEDTCKAKSTSSKSCKCSTTWDKCLCTTIVVEQM